MYGKPRNFRENSNGTVHPGGNFLKKSNTVRGITFFPFLPKKPKFSVTFVWITIARPHVQRKRKLYRYFVNGTTQSRSCFPFQKKIAVPFGGNFPPNFHANGKRSWTPGVPSRKFYTRHKIEAIVWKVSRERKS